MGLLDFFKTNNNNNNNNNLDLDFVFKLSDHIRYENGKHASGPHSGALRAVKVQPNVKGSGRFSDNV
jgi:hypothetical protein